MESRSRRVLTILGRLSSDLQPIVDPAPPSILSLSLSHFHRPSIPNSPRVSTLPPLVPLRSLPRPPPPPTSRFLNPHRFRPRYPLEFESTQAKSWSHQTFICLLPPNEGVLAFSILLRPPSSERGERPSGFSEPLRTPRCSDQPPSPSVTYALSSSSSSSSIPEGEKGTDLSEKSRRKILRDDPN